MKLMKLGILGAAAAGLLGVVAACAADGTAEEPNPAEPDRDGGTTTADAGPVEDAAPDVDLDAERPLRCGDAGFCETRLPMSDRGTPLSLRSVWAVASNDVWSVTAEGFVLHYDGANWQTAYRTGVSLSTVWATATGVWAGGEAGMLLHKDAAGAWSQLATAHLSTIRSIAGTSDADVWFASDDGLVDRFDGTSLNAYPIDIVGIQITAVAGGPGLGVYATGYVKENRSGESLRSQPYVLEMKPAGALVFNPMQPGFTPISLDVVGTSDAPKVFVFGYKYVPSFDVMGFGIVERVGDVALHEVSSPEPYIRMPTGCGWDRERGTLHACPAWMHALDDVLVPFSADYSYAYVLRLKDSQQASTSLAMGDGFVPRAIHGVHGTTVDTWLVGDGFALKGATQ